MNLCSIVLVSFNEVQHQTNHNTPITLIRPAAIFPRGIFSSSCRAAGLAGESMGWEIRGIACLPLPTSLPDIRYFPSHHSYSILQFCKGYLLYHISRELVHSKKSKLVKSSLHQAKMDVEIVARTLVLEDTDLLELLFTYLDPAAIKNAAEVSR